MTEVRDAPTAGMDGGEAARDAVAATPGARPWFVAEGLLAAELLGLASFAFARRVLDGFGHSPETFLAREAGALTVVGFGLVVALAPAAVLALAGSGWRLVGPTARRRAHALLVAVVAALAVWQTGQSLTGYPPTSDRLRLAAVVAGPAVALARSRWPSTRTFLRLAAVGAVIFLGQFLFLSPVSGLVTGGGASLGTADVAGQLGDDPPDVVLVIFDELPTSTLLDGTGHIDAEAFPNFARLAGTATWYRNHTTVAESTPQAVPAILTGRAPDAGHEFLQPDPENLFTLLGGSYDVHGREAITRLCRAELCPVDPSGSLPELLRDAVDLWATGDESPAADPVEFNIRALDDEGRFPRAAAFVDAFAPDPASPDLYVHHIVLPHGPWRLTGDGTSYASADESVPLGVSIMGYGEVGRQVGRQRHALQTQAADRLLGRLLDRLEAAGTFDDSIVVVTADHGISFMAGEPWRFPSEANYADIMWTPLLVKAPGQESGTIVDADVRSTDVLPTITDLLGVDIPWEVDGIPAPLAVERRDGPTKPIHNDGRNPLHDDDPDRPSVDVDARDGFARVLAADGVEGSGPDGPWKRTAHGDLFGRRVADLDVGEPLDGTIALQGLDRFAAIDTGEPVDIELVGVTGLDEGTVFAYTVNGTVAAVGAVEGPYRSGHLAHGLAPPELFRDGANDIAAYVVEGPVGDEALRPVALEDG